MNTGSLIYDQNYLINDWNLKPIFVCFNMMNSNIDRHE